MALISRLGAKVFRRNSGIPTEPSSASDDRAPAAEPQPSSSSTPKRQTSFPSLRRPSGRAQVAQETEGAPPPTASSQPQTIIPLPEVPSTHIPTFNRDSPPKLTLEEASPDLEPVQSTLDNKRSISRPIAPLTPVSPGTEPQQSSLPVSDQAYRTGSSIVQPYEGHPASSIPSRDYFGEFTHQEPPMMPRRKIWVKRPGASATTVQIAEDDLVDDVRDMVLRKYANSLGRSFDAPDVTIRIVPREKSQQATERTLSPEEPIYRTIEAYFPGGQTVEEALLIDIPSRRTPRPSPRIVHPAASYFEEHRPLENGSDYFPPMPVAVTSTTSHDGRLQYHQPIHPHSISVLDTGQLPALPSPRERKGHARPKYVRQHTSSPTVVGNTSQPAAALTSQPIRHQRSRVDSTSSNHVPTPPPIPTPPAPEANSMALSTKASTPPADQTQSPRLPRKKNAKSRNSDSHQHRKGSHQQQLPTGLLDGVVPPINVLIVEDNIINLKLLEANVKRLKVRWQTAMNGREAVTKWRQGGFHLVLMDIQLPIMNGLDATKEIRRLERVNGIGVFAKTEHEVNAANAGDGANAADRRSSLVGDPQGDDKLPDEGLFKSPVIIVALTASSLQSDRHEALAAGCNDFLTKPVNKEWFERKVMEWGCMQALIDFDGWRQWKQEADEKQRLAELDPSTKEKQEKKEAKRAALLAKMGQT